MIRRAVTDEQIPAMDRVTAMLLPLYAQPITRIVQLALDDITNHDGQILLLLGDPPTPVPEPFAQILLAYTAAQPNTDTVTNPDSRRLFPGRRAGRSVHPDHHRTTAPRPRLHTGPGPHLSDPPPRPASPAPVVASRLGYNSEGLAVIAAEAAGPWSRYAPGDHIR